MPSPAKSEELDAFWEIVEQAEREKSQASLHVESLVAQSNILRGCSIPGSPRCYFLVISPTIDDTSYPWRVTRFVDDGPWGHHVGKTKLEAIQNEGLCPTEMLALEVATEEQFRAMTEAPKFTNGVELLRLTGILNRLLFWSRYEPFPTDIRVELRESFRAIVARGAETDPVCLDLATRAAARMRQIIDSYRDRIPQ